MARLAIVSHLLHATSVAARIAAPGLKCGLIQDI